MQMILDLEDYAQWLTGTPEDAFALIKSFPAERMVIHQSGEALKSDHGGMTAAG
jgi:putative SOS response-associated peptidase YedK